MNDAVDPFLVSSPLGITAVLRSVAAQKSLVHMRIDGHERALITTVLHVDQESRCIMVDASSDEVFNKRLGSAQAVHFDAMVDKIHVLFSTGQATAQPFEGRSAFRVPYPDSLRRMQRRENYRVDIPVSWPLLCQITASPGQSIQLRVKDISASGVALLDPEPLLNVTPGTIFQACQLDLGDLGTLTTGLQVSRVHKEAAGDAKPVRVVACEFVALPAAGSVMLQNYIVRLERKLNARRRGFD